TPVTADFSVSSVKGDIPLTVTFSDMSEGRVDDRVWDFGDGNTSSDANPVHVYTKPGTYTVSLAVSNYAHSDSKEGIVTALVPDPPDIEISRFDSKVYGEGNYGHKVEKTVLYGNEIYLGGELTFSNKSKRETASGVEFECFIGDDFHFDKNDFKVVHSDAFDIAPNATVTKNMGKLSIKVSDDGKSIIVSGAQSKIIPTLNGVAQFYLSAYVKVKGVKDGDWDISSATDTRQYAVVKITAQRSAICNLDAKVVEGKPMTHIIIQLLLNKGDEKEEGGFKCF
ncbi:MAG: PKD domain-containing protein, partial [Patescibacteria group bacterium]